MSDTDFRRLCDEAKARRNLSDIVSRHTKLTRRGKLNVHGLCPFHVEKSPSFEVSDTKGTYFCHGCRESGDAFTYLQKKDGLTFRQAFEALTNETFPVVTEEERTKRKQEAEAATARRIASGRRAWDRSRPAAGTLAEVYARSRGITAPLPDTVRFAHFDYRNQETGDVIARSVPTMVCVLQDASGSVVGIQRIYLAPDGLGKMPVPKPKLSLGIIVGSAFRASGSSDPDTSSLIVCEGPEDGLSLAQQLPDASVWVAAGTAMLPVMIFPPITTTVTIGADGDEPGEVAAQGAAAAFTDLGLLARIMRPSPGFKDFNAELMGAAA